MVTLRSFFARLTGLLALIALHWACTPPETGTFEPADPVAQYPYFPLETGKYIDYAVDSVVYDFAPGGTILRDSSHTLLRELVADTLRDNTGQLHYTIERYERPNDTATWQLKQIWTAARTATQAIRTENNLRFLKLVFPFDRRSQWNGNLWIDQYQEIEIAGERIRPFVNWNYAVDSLDIAAQIGSFAFDSVLVVTEVDETNAIERRLSRVRYAKHLGLVWREQWILDSQYCNQTPAPSDCLTKPWEEKAQKGYLLRQVIQGHN